MYTVVNKYTAFCYRQREPCKILPKRNSELIKPGLVGDTEVHSTHSLYRQN